MSRQWRILHLTHTDVREDARILRQLDCLDELAEGGCWAVGVSSGQEVLDVIGRPRSRIETIDLRSRRLLWLPRPIRYMLNLCELALRMLPTAIRKRPDVVHCHDTLVLPLGVLVSLFTGCRVIYDAHELESDKAGQSRVLSWGTLLIERICWRRISLLVSVSPSILDWYRESVGPKRSVLVLNSPVLRPSPGGELELGMRSFGATGYFHRHFGIPEGVPVFIYLGLLVGGRGIGSVLEVFRRPGIRSHVVFMGSGDTVGVRDHAERHPNIHLHPTVPHDQVVPLVREADCGLCLIEDVSLSDRLCLPNKLFEYAFAGVPVLASRLPEIARVVHEYRLGVCCDNDVASISAAVHDIEQNGLEGSKASLTELSWGRQAQRLKHAYKELALEVLPVVKRK